MRIMSYAKLIVGNKFFKNVNIFFDNVLSYKADNLRQDLLNKYSQINSYYSLVKDFVVDKEYLSDRDMAFLSIKLDSCTNDVIQRLGDPKLKVRVSDSIEIYFYKRRFLKEKIKVEYHFYKKKVFFIYVKFSNIDGYTKQNVLKVLENKYGERFSSDKVIVKNQYNHALMVVNHLDFTLSYVSLGSEFLKNIKELNEKEALKQKIKNERFKNYLYKNL